MQPTARAVNFRADKLRENQKEKAGQIHRQRAPTNPAIVDQTGDHEGEEADRDPVCLLAPEFRRHGIFAHISRAVDCHHSEDREREHVRE